MTISCWCFLLDFFGFSVFCFSSMSIAHFIRQTKKAKNRMRLFNHLNRKSWLIFIPGIPHRNHNGCMLALLAASWRMRYLKIRPLSDAMCIWDLMKRISTIVEAVHKQTAWFNLVSDWKACLEKLYIALYTLCINDMKVADIFRTTETKREAYAHKRGDLVSESFTMSERITNIFFCNDSWATYECIAKSISRKQFIRRSKW